MVSSHTLSFYTLIAKPIFWITQWIANSCCKNKTFLVSELLTVNDACSILILISRTARQAVFQNFGKMLLSLVRKSHLCQSSNVSYTCISFYEWLCFIYSKLIRLSFVDWRLHQLCSAQASKAVSCSFWESTEESRENINGWHINEP